MEEIWKKIKGYHPSYEVSNRGRVRTTNYRHTGETHLIGVFNNSVGSVSATIKRDDGRYGQVTVHKLVAIAFKGYDPSRMSRILHLDGDKTNNRPENLHIIYHKK